MIAPVPHGKALGFLVALVLATAVPVQSPSAASEPKTIVVIGDSLGEGLYTGLRIRLQGKSDVTVKNLARVNTSLVRSDRFDWTNAVDTLASERGADIVVAMFGANDLQSIHEGGHAYHYPSDSWKERYVARVDHIMSTLKAAGMEVEWVGLPITRENRFQKDYEFLNRIFEEQSRTNGIGFFDTWAATAGAGGEYDAYGSDIDNKTAQIRDPDGVHFTGPGYVLLAEKVIRAMGL